MRGLDELIKAFYFLIGLSIFLVIALIGVLLYG